MKPLRHALLIVLLAALSFKAWAGASAQASLTNLQATLLDLDPDDGITPALSIYKTTTLARATGSQGATWLDVAPALGSDFSFTESNNNHEFTLRMTAGDMFKPNTGPGASVSLVERADKAPQIDLMPLFIEFDITPNTQVVFTATGSAQLAGFNGVDPIAASALIASALLDSTGMQIDSSARADLAFVYVSPQWTADPVVGATLLSTTLSNSSAISMQGYFIAAVDVQLIPAVPSVPEPATWLLAALGIAWLLPQVRSRNRLH